MKEALLSYKYIKDEIAVFDRGLQSRKTVVSLDSQSIDFVTRLNDKAVYEERSHLGNVAGHRYGNLTLQKDAMVYLQNLKVKHLISYSQNGIAVFIYMILIAAIMISIYQIENAIQYWVEAKRKLCYELKVWLTRDILILFDGNIQKFDNFITAGGRM